MKLVITIVVSVLALALLWKMLGWLIGFTWGLANFALGLLWLALIVGAIIFIVGLVRRLMMRL
jgi:hypothetical protein